MAQRSIWKGTISFGMVAIPAKLYSATEDQKVELHQAHRECMTRIKMPRWCPTCDRKVEGEEILRVYELAKDQYVPLDESDFQTLPLKSLKVVEVDSFVNADNIDPRLFDKSYFLVPEDVGLKAFHLLRKAMEKSKLAAVAKLGYRDREHLALVCPHGRGMLLQTLHYADELRSIEDFSILSQEAMISEKEMASALALVEALKVEDFDLSKYHNEYREALIGLIEAKMQGKVVTAPTAPKATSASDLDAALQASIDAIAARAWEKKPAKA